MALRKQLEDAKKRSADSGVEPDRNVLSKEQRHQRISLFLQDFDHQDLKEEDAAAATAVATLEKSNCGIGNLHSPRLIRTNSKRVKVTTIVEYKEAKEDQGTQSKKTSQKIFKTKSLTSAITDKKGILCRFAQRGLFTGNSERTQTSSLRSSSMPPERSLPFVNIPLSDGQTLCSSGDDIQNIDVQLLNNDTVQHIHTLVNQLTALCGKATVK
ncbi:hypothetical protein Chor_013405 [Crotalus horridus]